MKKLLLALVPILIIGLAISVYNYFERNPFEKMVLCKSIKSDGSPLEKYKKDPNDKHGGYLITPKDTTLYVSAKVKNPFIKKAFTIWNLKMGSKKDRLKVENNIPVSKSGYVSSKLTVSEFKNDEYVANIYKEQFGITYGNVTFKVKK